MNTPNHTPPEQTQHHVHDFTLSDGELQRVDVFPEQPVEGALYFTPPMVGRDTDAWQKLPVDERFTQLDRRIALLQGIGKVMSSEHKQLRDISLTDALTGLKNRRAFMTSLQERVKHSNGKFAVMFIDLDRFKQVNDTLGHAKGDELLKLVADKVQNNAHLREGDEFFRIGGDEFVVIAKIENNKNGRRKKGIAPDDAIHGLADRLVGVVESAAKDLEVDFVSASIGVEKHIDGESPEDLVARADAKMYEVKRESKTKKERATE